MNKNLNRKFDLINSYNKFYLLWNHNSKTMYIPY